MRFEIRKYVLVLALILIPTFAVADVPYPLGRSLFDLDYALTYHKAIASSDLIHLPSTGPFRPNTFKDISINSTALGLIDNLPDSDVRLFSIATERLRIARRERADDLPLLTGGIRYQASEYFGMLMLFNMDRAKAIDPYYTGKKWRGLAGDVETAAIYFTKGGLSMTLGRQRMFWGPQPVNLILSETAEPLDMFSAGYEKGRLKFSFIFARLDQSRPDSSDYLRLPNQTFNDNRYLVGHRLDILFRKNIRLGLFETSIFGGEGRPPELYYLNPLQFFHAAQVNENEDDNTIVGFDLFWMPWRGLGMYGQMIIDDFQFDNKSQGDQEPNEIGWMCGLLRTGRIGTLSPDIKLEYVRIANRTYHQSQPRNRYLYRNELLGHPLGPDADSLSILFRFWPSVKQFTELELSYCRHGEGSIYAPWSEPWVDVTGDYSEPFPTGIVEKSINLAVRLNGYLPLTRYTSEHIFVTLEGDYSSIKNRLHVESDSGSTARINLSLTWLGYLNIGIME
jgi:hypothetical protein